MNIEVLKTKTERFLKQNSSTILTGIAVMGVVGTVYSTIKATTKANEEINGVENEIYMREDRELTKMEKVRVGARYYIPVVGIAGGTIVCIIGAQVLNKRQQVMLTSAYISLQQTYKEYRDIVAEKSLNVIDEEGEIIDIGDEATKEMLKRRFSDAPIPENGELLWYDEEQSAFFTSTMECVMYAEDIVKKTDRQLGFVDLAVLHSIEGSPGFPIEYYVKNVEFTHKQILMDDGPDEVLPCIYRTMTYDKAYIPR